MEERKLVDIEEVKDVLGDTINSEGDYRHALRLLDCLSATTEQEIVKPYLEKLKTTFEEYRDNWNRFRNDYESGRYKAYDICVDEVDELIDNLLSEQEVKHGSD
jgi:hypothetical protein